MKRVYLFEEGSADMRDLLGGKGANLAEMTNIGLPVPPGFTITTDVCRGYMKRLRLPDGLMQEVHGSAPGCAFPLPRLTGEGGKGGEGQKGAPAPEISYLTPVPLSGERQGVRATRRACSPSARGNERATASSITAAPSQSQSATAQYAQTVALCSI
jgi:hypothetical protein